MKKPATKPANKNKVKTLPPLPKKLKWTVEFTIDAMWVEDGFNLTKDRAQEMIENALSWATSYEVHARIISAPHASIIKRVQGYK